MLFCTECSELFSRTVKELSDLIDESSPNDCSKGSQSYILGCKIPDVHAVYIISAQVCIIWIKGGVTEKKCQEPVKFS